MGSTATRSHARRRIRFRHSKLGNRALDFGRWFTRSKYALMASFLGELEQAPRERDETEIKERYCRTITHAERAQNVRGVVTFLLAIGVVASASTTLVRVMSIPSVMKAAVLVDRIAAITASLTLLLVGVRLACDRYLERVDVTATFLAIQLATADRRAKA